MSVTDHDNEWPPPNRSAVESKVTGAALTTAVVPEEMECTQVFDVISDTCSESVVELDTTNLENNNNNHSNSPKPLAWLKVMSYGASQNVPQGLPSIIPLFPGVTTFGRDSGSDYQFKLPSLSRNHASIEANGRGVKCFLLTDLGSRNGTLVNKKKLPANEKYGLDVNDTVTFGDVELVLLFEDPSTVEISSASVIASAVSQPQTQSSRKRKLQNQAKNQEDMTPRKLDNLLNEALEPSNVCPTSSLSKPGVRMSEPKDNRYSMFFKDSPRTSVNIFDESKVNESSILDLNKTKMRSECLVEETFCDADPDNNDYDDEEEQNAENGQNEENGEFHVGNEKVLIINETCHDLNLANYKFKDESSKSASNSNGSSKRNSFDLSFDVRDDSPANNNLMKDLHRKILEAKCVNESPLVKVGETIKFNETVTSVGETPEDSLERKRADDTVIVSETVSSYENLAVMSPASRNQAFNASTDNGHEESGSYEKAVIAETCFDITNSHEMINSDHSKADEDLLESLDKEAEKQERPHKSEQNGVEPDENSPESVPASPSMFNLPPEENNLSDEVYGLKCSTDDPLVCPTSITPGSSDNKVSDVLDDDKVYDADTLDMTGYGDADQVNNSGKEMTDVNTEVAQSPASKKRVNQRRTSLEDLGFSDDDDDTVNGSSIVTSSQRELANKTITSINTPMKHRLKRRNENAKKQKMDKRMAKTEEIVEEIAATFDDDNFDSVNGMKDVQLEISAIESISKRSGVDEESSVQSTASSKAAKKPRGRGRATKKSEESNQQLSQQFDILPLPTDVQLSKTKVGQQQSDESKKVTFENDINVENSSASEPVVNLKKELASQMNETEKDGFRKDLDMQSKRKRGVRRALVLPEVASKTEDEKISEVENSSDISSSKSRSSRSSGRTTKSKADSAKSKKHQTSDNNPKTTKRGKRKAIDDVSQLIRSNSQASDQSSAEQFDKELNDMVGCDENNEEKRGLETDIKQSVGYSEVNAIEKTNEAEDSTKEQYQISETSNVDTVSPVSKKGRKKAGLRKDSKDMLLPKTSKQRGSQVPKDTEQQKILIESPTKNRSARSRQAQSLKEAVAENNEDNTTESAVKSKRGRGRTAKISIKQEPNTSATWVAEEDNDLSSQGSEKKERSRGRPPGAKNKINVEVKTEEEMSPSPVGKRNSPRKKIVTSELYSSPKTSPRKGKRSLKTGGAVGTAKKSKLKDALDTEEESDNAGIKKEPDAPKGRKRGAAASGKSASKLAGGSSSSVSSDNSCRSPKRSRSIGGQPTYVMFTGISDKEVAKYTKQLRASLGPSCQFGDDCSQCVFLVTDKIRRTKKFLCALARGVNIVGVKWVEACDRAKSLVDAAGYILSDKANEAKFEMNLEQSIQIARENKGILKELRIHVTSSVEPTPAEMKEIVTSAGGTVLPRMPANPDDKRTIIVTAEKDRPKLKSSLLPCCKTKEFVLCAIMKQFVELENHSFV